MELRRYALCPMYSICMADFPSKPIAMAIVNFQLLNVKCICCSHSKAEGMKMSSGFWCFGPGGYAWVGWLFGFIFRGGVFFLVVWGRSCCLVGLVWSFGFGWLISGLVCFFSIQYSQHQFLGCFVFFLQRHNWLCSLTLYSLKHKLALLSNWCNRLVTPTYFHRTSKAIIPLSLHAIRFGRCFSEVLIFRLKETADFQQRRGILPGLLLKITISAVVFV